MYLIVTRSFPPEIGGMQSLMWGLANEMSKNFRLKSMIIIFLVSTIFIGRNVDRIIYELDFYKANFKQNMFFFTDKNILELTIN